MGIYFEVLAFGRVASEREGMSKAPWPDGSLPRTGAMLCVAPGRLGMIEVGGGR